MLKSISTQFVLTLFLGPLGLAYSSVAAAVFLTLVFAVLYFTEIGTMAIAIVWPLAIITGLVFVKLHNDRMRQSGSRLLLGPGEEGDLVSAIGSWGRGLVVLTIMAVGGYLAYWYQGDQKPGWIIDAPGNGTDSNVATENSTPSIINVATAEPVSETPVVDTVSESVPEPVTVAGETMPLTGAEPVVIGTSAEPEPKIETDQSVLYVDAPVVNLRSGPGTDFSILVQLDRGEELAEINRDGAWLNVTSLSSGTVGWIYEPLVTTQQ